MIPGKFDPAGVSRLPMASYHLTVGVPESPVDLKTVQVKENGWLACG